MVCWKVNFKINNFQKVFVHQGHPQKSLSGPPFLTAGTIFVIVGVSHIIITLEEAH